MYQYINQQKLRERTVAESKQRIPKIGSMVSSVNRLNFTKNDNNLKKQHIILPCRTYEAMNHSNLKHI